MTETKTGRRRPALRVEVRFAPDDERSRAARVALARLLAELGRRARAAPDSR
jgi:hypothetical protein